MQHGGSGRALLSWLYNRLHLQYMNRSGRNVKLRRQEGEASMSQITPTTACLTVATSGLISQRRESYRLATASARACKVTRSSLTCVTEQERPVAAARSAVEARFMSCRVEMTKVPKKGYKKRTRLRAPAPMAAAWATSGWSGPRFGS